MHVVTGIGTRRLNRWATNVVLIKLPETVYFVLFGGKCLYLEVYIVNTWEKARGDQGGAYSWHFFVYNLESLFVLNVILFLISYEFLAFLKHFIFVFDFF